MGPKMDGAFGRIGPWASATTLVALLATGCGSQNMPASAQATGGSDGGGADGSDSSRPVDTGAGGTDALTPTGDGGLGAADAGTVSGDAATCGGPLVLSPQRDATFVYVCSFQANPPPDPKQVVVYSDEDLTDLVPASPSDGWRWGDASETTILLTGSFCSEALAGDIPRLFVLYTCALPPIP
jgi:hypothetical protein